MTTARRLVAMDRDETSPSIADKPIPSSPDRTASRYVPADPGPVDLDVHLERTLRALATVREAHGRLDEYEAELIAEARRVGAPWRAVSHALGLRTPQAGYQRAARLQARLTEE